MKNKQKFWIVSEIFYPDLTTTAYILTEIAQYLSKYYCVNILTGPIGYDKENIDGNHSKLLTDIHIKRCSCIISNKSNLLLRVLRQCTITLKLMIYILLYTSKKDKILIVTNPAPLLLGIALLRALKQFELTVLVHDVFPENTVPAGIFKSPNNIFYKIIKNIFSWAYSRADKLIVLGRDMQKIIQEKIKKSTNQPQIHIIGNWAETETIYPLPREKCLPPKFHSKIILGYAGNYGRVQGLMKLLSIAEKTQNKMIYFRFWGSGAMDKYMRDYVSKNDLKNVEINGAYTRKEQQIILNSCDIAFVSLATGMYGLGVPSKTYNILAAGKPIIFIGNKDSEIGKIIIENEIGWIFDEFEDKKLEQFLSHLSMNDFEDLKNKKERCRQLAEIKYTKNIILKKIHSVIK